MSFKFIWNKDCCSITCTECIDTCMNNVLSKDENGLLCLNDTVNCERCESCYMVCMNCALNLVFIQDGDNKLYIEYEELI